MRIYVVETATYRGRWPLGNVTGLGTARFEIPDHLGAELGNLILVAEPWVPASCSSPIVFTRCRDLSWIGISVPCWASRSRRFSRPELSALLRDYLVEEEIDVQTGGTVTARYTF